MHPYRNILEIYMTALDQGDYNAVKRLFVRDGKVKSPFLPEMPANQFFDRLAGVSLKTIITPIDIFLSSPENNHAIAYFQFDWTIRDGTLISFKVMDLFTFERGSDKVTYLDLIYDTHPIRNLFGNKYEEF